MSTSKFDVIGQLDRSRVMKGKVIIDRDAALYTVRPHRKRKTYTLPLLTVAGRVCRKENAIEISPLRGSRFPVEGKLALPGKRKRSVDRFTVVVNRDMGLFMVRPHRKRQVYAMGLSATADWACRAATIAELRARRAGRG
jgi:hypothetical protein